MQGLPIEAVTEEEREYGNEIFDSEDEMKSSLKMFCHGDFYVIGRLWIEALRKVLIGAKLSLIPVIHAAAEPEPPKKPPPMKFQDLPLYESPHYEYKDYLEDKKKCPKANVKLLHQYLYPKVKNYRQEWVDSYAELKREVGEMREDACSCYSKKRREFKKYMRDPNNMLVRQAIVALGTAAGYYIGSGRGIPRRIFFTSVGAFSTGALCFPKESDEIFRDLSYRFGKFALSILNTTCGKNFTMRERLPCRDDLPPPPPKRTTVNKCSEKK